MGALLLYVHIPQTEVNMFYADSPVAGYAISQTDDQLEALGEDVGVTKEAVPINTATHSQLARP